jgi:uncharacterized membrane protein
VARDEPGEGETAKLVYILYLASLIVGVTSIIGLIMAYVYRPMRRNGSKPTTDSRSVLSGSVFSTRF